MRFLLIKCWPCRASRGRRERKNGDVQSNRSVGALGYPFREQAIEVIRNVLVSSLTQKWNRLELDYVNLLRKVRLPNFSLPPPRMDTVLPGLDSNQSIRCNLCVL